MINQYIKAGTTFATAYYSMKDERIQDSSFITNSIPNDESSTVFNEVAKAYSLRQPLEIKPAAAIVRAIDEFHEVHSNENCESGCLITNSGDVYTQYKNGNGEYTLTHISRDSFSASVMDEYGGIRPYILKQSKRDGSDKTFPDGIFFGLLSYLLLSDDHGICDDYQKAYSNEFRRIMEAKTEEEARKYYAVLSEEIRSMLENPAAYADDNSFIAAELIVPNPLEMDMTAVESLTSYGKIDKLPVKGKEVGHASSYNSIRELRDVYATKRVLSEEEKRMIPVLPESYTIPDKMVYALELITKSDRFRNFILRGPAGTGKTEWVKILASSLGLPYLFFCCSTDTEKMDLTMSIIPADTEESFDATGIDPSSWVLDPVMAYSEITGQVKPDATEKDCLIATVARAGGKANNFKYVESNLVRAFRRGYVVEVQEPTIMTRAGVLASLNSMFDGCKAVTLVNGETVYRHEDAIVVYTTNTSYEGCVGLNQSALSRMVCIDLNDLTDEKIIERLKNNTGYGNEAVLKKMIKVYHTCQQKAEQEAIMDGSIDMRAMEDWAAANAITGSGTIYQNGMNMLISKTSNDPILREEFISCMEEQFKPTD